LQQTKGADMPEVAPTREQVEEVVEMVPAAALAEARADCEAMGTVLDLLHERLPDAQCMGDLPGCVDELRAEADARGWQPIATAPRDELIVMWGARNQRAVIDKWGDYCAINQPRFTHWIPIQPGPEADEKEQRERER
jgi:hypothetical protein